MILIIPFHNIYILVYTCTCTQYSQVYAVGTYIDQTNIQSININKTNTDNVTDTDTDANNKNDIKKKIEKAQSLLCNPTTLPRAIRIVTHWNIPMKLLTKGITDALRPRLKDKISLNQMLDLERELSSIMNSDDANDDDVKVGTEIIMFVKDDTMHYSRPVKQNGHGSGSDDASSNNMMNEEKKIQHKDFCLALCDIYYGNDPVSTDHKAKVMEGIMKAIF